MLFADAVSDAGGLVGYGAGAVSLVSALITGYFAYASNRDRLRYDQQMTELKAENKQLKESEKECRDDHKELKGEFIALRTKMESERDRSAEERHKLEAEIQKQRDMKHELNGRLAQLQAQLSLQGVNVDIKPIQTGGSGAMPAPPKPPPPPDQPF